MKRFALRRSRVEPASRPREGSAAAAPVRAESARESRALAVERAPDSQISEGSASAEIEESAGHAFANVSIAAARVGRVVQRDMSPDVPPADVPPGASGEPLSGGGAGGSSTSVTINAVSREISGANLTAVWAAMTNSGTRESASVQPKFTPAPNYEYDDSDKVKKVVITVVETKTMPQWKELASQCAPIRAEWNRFYGVLEAHENRHLEIDKKHFSNLHLKLVGKGREEAWRLVDDEIAAADAENAAYDTKSANGVNEGANLNTAVQCEPEKIKSSAESAPASEGMSLGERAPFDELVQAKLAVSTPGDAYEQEADQVAERVLEPDLALTVRAASTRRAQRCAGPGLCQCDECKRKAKLMREQGIPVPSPTHDREANALVARAATSAPEVGGTLDPEASRGIERVVSRNGETLDANTRAFMESRFGHDFARVRIHHDDAAAESAAAIRARAYTLGSDVVFAAGHYAPHTRDGLRLLAHELTHVVQQGYSAPTVRRDTSPAPAPAPNAPSAMADAGALVEKDKKAFDALASKVGQPAGRVLSHVPRGPEDLRAADVVTIQQVMDRSGGADSRKGFETQGQATAYAAMNARPAGATVLQQDGIYFAAKLAPNANISLVAVKPPLPPADWSDPVTGKYGEKIAKSDWNKYRAIYRIDLQSGALTIVGQDGMIFPEAWFTEVDPRAVYKGLAPKSGGISSDAGTNDAAASQLDKTQLPGAPTAADMRTIGGLTTPGGKGDLTTEQQEAFLGTYFKARAEESIARNEKTVEQLVKDFKPAESKDADKSGSKISPNAQKMIDSSRKLAKDFRTILETQAIIQGKLDYVENAISRPGGGPALKLTMDGKETWAVDWKDHYTKALARIAEAVVRIRSASPMLALMVPDERQSAPLTAASALSTGVDVLGSMANPIVGLKNLAGNQAVREFVLNTPRTPQGKNQVDASAFGEPQSAQSDEKMREQFQKKLDVAMQAVRKARAEIVHGDLDMLMSLSGLRVQVAADVANNPSLKAKLEEMLAKHEIKETTWTILETVVQVGALFLPGGAFISAAIGMATAVRDFGKDLAKWDIAQAGQIDPSSALVSTQEVEASLVADTLMIALQALDLGTAVVPELHAANDFRREIAGIVEHDGTHELKLTSLGITRCSDVCLNLSQSLIDRAEHVRTMASAEVHPEISGMGRRAEAMEKRAQEIGKMPKGAERDVAEQELLRDAHALEMEMAAIEHEVFGVKGNIFPAADKGKWGADGKGVRGQGPWYPEPGHRARNIVGDKPIMYDNGFPNLTPWAEHQVSIKMTGGPEDFIEADKKGIVEAFQRNPQYFGKIPPNPPVEGDVAKFTKFRQEFGYTWHHKENGITMQLVPTELHSSIPHLGGSSLSRGVEVK